MFNEYLLTRFIDCRRTTNYLLRKNILTITDVLDNEERILNFKGFGLKCCCILDLALEKMSITTNFFDRKSKQNKEKKKNRKLNTYESRIN
jgi:hypothetical protein